MAVLWKLEPATAAKHRLYRRYLDAWWPILLQPSRTGFVRPQVTFMDAFAGPGEYEGGEEGSPVLVLNRLLTHTFVERMMLSRRRVRLIFIEKDAARFDHLRRVLTRRFGPLEDLPVHVDLRRGEAKDAAAVLTEVRAWGHPVLAIFDSWGNVNVPLTVMAQIARNRSSEVITTFGPNWFSRRAEENPEALDMVFGGREYWQAAEREGRPDERWRAWLSTYRDALGRAGFAHRLQFQVVPRTGQPLYLVYGTNHQAGVEAMKDAMWEVDGNDGMSFKDPRTRGAPMIGQMALGVGPVQDELLELVNQRVQQAPVTLGDLGIWLLLETARWRKQDAKRAVRELVDSGVVTIEPTGRLTARTRVMPR
ncbi:hypothetical protein Acsp03_37850 [Actinomadura sp. NBRC 104412]|uniref:three-Cys-motif partner protein TcmP n=1 Tax=Actinomadura sp. NBRC 104412 TaxID=3032203 RepID=UPI0024A0772F|nr:three-Cys-motif partner protein TcmP [Actinomadura sp. NBRC 104412]GLZ06319.1 hypothetical protein Acsp03_37850 [Actinomadura sp. NBRC 104412]